MRNIGVRKERTGKRISFLLLFIILEATLYGESRQKDVSTSFDLLETEYVVTVNLSRQEVTVFRNGRAVRSMVCSSGIPRGDNGTPTGRYIIDESGKKRGEWFFSRTYGEGAEYWVGFIGGIYLFHSVPMNSEREVIPSQEALLGQPASHGCIRLSVADARWFYETIPSGSVLHIYGTTPGEEGLPKPPIQKKQEASLWLTHHHQSYYQKHLLSCEAALIRLFLAMAGVDAGEDDILDAMPWGSDPESSFVCLDIDRGRRGPENTIIWDNYGTHPPVVRESIEHWLGQEGKAQLYEVREESLTDGELGELCAHDDSFLGAILWVIGHPDRWGSEIRTNERGMVLGEHVRYLNPELSSSGEFLVWDPEVSTDQPRRYTSFPTRRAFGYRVITIRVKE